MKNTEIAKKYLQSVYTQDMDTARSLLAPMVKLTMNGNNQLSGTHEGIEEFFEAFRMMMEITQNTYRMDEQIEWLEGDKRAVLLAIESAESDGKRYQFNRVVDYKIDGGEITEVKIFEGEPKTVDVVFAQ